MSVTIAVCTRGDAPTLHSVLSRALAQLPSDGELLIILSGRDEHVAAPTDPRVVQRANAEPGIAAARAAALKHAKFDAVCFVDDDTLAADGWLATHVAALSSGAGMTGGPISVEWPEGQPPRWLDPRLRASYGFRPNGAGHLPYGGNMGVSVAAVNRVGGFRTDLGHIRDALALHEDTELATRMLRAGLVVLEVDGAVVHVVRQEAVRRRWLLLRAWSEGRSDARRDAPVGARRFASHVVRLLIASPVIMMVWLPAAATTYLVARLAVNASYVWAALRYARRSASA